MPEFCEKVEERAWLLVDKEILPEELDELLRHIRQCALCKQRFDKTVQLKMKLSKLKLPEALPMNFLPSDDVLEKLQRKRKIFLILCFLVALIALIVIILIAYFAILKT